MTARLKTYVHVEDDKGQIQIFGPGDVVPVWAREKITNTKAWEEPTATDSSPSDPDPGAGSGPQVPDLPPRSGKGSGKENWAAYAAAQGVEVPDGASREDIIERLLAADVRVDPVDPAAE